MSVSTVETKTGSAAAGVATSIAITTSVLATDLIVVVIGKSNTTGSITVTGWGGTWVIDASMASGRAFRMTTLSGVTGTGTVAVTGSTGAVDVTVHVLRSSTATLPRLFLHAASPWTNTTTTANVVEMAPEIFAPAGSFAVAAGCTSAGTITFPTASSSPASGSWTSDMSTANLQARSYAVGSDMALAAGISSTSTTNIGAYLAIFFDEEIIVNESTFVEVLVADPVAVTGFIGWGSPMAV